eukprot:CAMPEP_0170073540 /NCGR_PEP_ID=MMETSP0019_2-20121128/10938_1 /TAXON_ID=98059 /ORGANISM="Dinobryon sp., Strain UTEXLB2267" /LENGTH=64 /DNA_ID=CAMNT_0010283133 /DNA_START=45 /DNA_END=236 /DNA_ORIENTATION=+
MKFEGKIVGMFLSLILLIQLNLPSLIFSGITGNALPHDVAHFLESGANEVIIKPLTKAKLVDAL